MPIVKIALAGIALGVCVMLLSILIITGFKNEITTKLSGFMAHLSITAYDHEDAYEVMILRGKVHTETSYNSSS